MKSLMDAIRRIGRLRDIDESRIALWGHSYGGFLTLRALSMDEVCDLDRIAFSLLVTRVFGRKTQMHIRLERGLLSIQA